MDRKTGAVGAKDEIGWNAPVVAFPFKPFVHFARSTHSNTLMEFGLGYVARGVSNNGSLPTLLVPPVIIEINQVAT